MNAESIDTIISQEQFNEIISSQLARLYKLDDSMRMVLLKKQITVLNMFRSPEQLHLRNKYIVTYKTNPETQTVAYEIQERADKHRPRNCILAGSMKVAEYYEKKIGQSPRQ
jgi:hypothetical protein